MTDGEKDILHEIEADARAIGESLDWRCVFCGTTATEDAALEAEWVDDFWMDSDIDGPEIDGEPCRAACPPCATAHLDDIDDDPCLKTGHKRFILTD